jgi:hypothetical protein
MPPLAVSGAAPGEGREANPSVNVRSRFGWRVKLVVVEILPHPSRKLSPESGVRDKHVRQSLCEIVRDIQKRPYGVFDRVANGFR